MLEIQGDILEGGGQILRTSLSLAALLQKDIHISRIRGKRKPPGLKPQHFTTVKAVATICEAEVEGLKEGSQDLFLRPRKRPSGKFQFDVGTAGSVTLVMQALMPIAASAKGPMEFQLSGGTDVKWSPTLDYVHSVLLPNLSKLGFSCEVLLRRRGHYPRGGGMVELKTMPAGRLKPLRLLERGTISRITGVSHCVKLPAHVARRQAEAAEKYLVGKGLAKPIIDVEAYAPDADRHLGPGSGINLCAEASAVLGGDSIGERGKPAEDVGAEAAEKLVGAIDSGAALDPHMGDMIVPYMALAYGRSEVTVSELTLHTITNVKITEIMTGKKFDVKGDLNGPGKIAVEGLGLDLSA